MTERDTLIKIKGVIPACITPMHESGDIDYGSLEKQIAYLSGQDIRGLFLNGTTGEGAYLAGSEKAQILRVARSVMRKDQFLYAACIKPSTAEVIKELRTLEKTRPDFLVSVAPYYLKASQDVVLQHFREIAGASPAPLIIYNIPQNTNNGMDFVSLLDLIETDNIAGIKDSSGDFCTFSRGVLSTAGKPFAWIQGEDFLDAASYMIGANAVVTGLGNVCLKPYIDMYSAADQGSGREVLEGQRKINALYKIIECAPGNGIAAIKAACSLLTRSKPWTRVPALRVSNAELDEIKTALKGLDLL
jgi:4-hydroxy-tetrahydrodipicolinate synthase